MHATDVITGCKFAQLDVQAWEPIKSMQSPPAQQNYSAFQVLRAKDRRGGGGM